MTEIPTVPASSSSPSPEEDAAFERMRTDAVLGGRAMSSGEFLAGLIADGQLETVGRPDKLPADLFPEVDPAVVQTIWDRALAVGLYAGRVSAAPRLYRDQMLRVQDEFAAAGFHAMGGLVGRSRRLVAPEQQVHPADGEDARGH
jgi:hypothetical protein